MDAHTPFDVTTMLDEALKNEAREQEAHDTFGARPRSLRLQKRNAANGDSGSPTQMSRDGEAVDNPQTSMDILEERNVTHGDFRENARISQAVKEILRSSPGWGSLCDVEREVMDMVALKFSRLLSGKSREMQHWEDVTGYSRLAERECE